MKLFRTHTWKRLIAVVLSAVLALSLLTGCTEAEVQEIIDILNEYASTDSMEERQQVTLTEKRIFGLSKHTLKIRILIKQFGRMDIVETMVVL